MNSQSFMFTKCMADSIENKYLDIVRERFKLNRGQFTLST